MLTIAQDNRPPTEDRRVLGQGLGDFNKAAHGPLPGGERWFFARDAAGAIQAGIKADEQAGWLYVDWLWVAEAFRRQGWGGRLLATAEEYARGRGLTGMHLNTWSFQAPDYYPRHGFICVGQLPDMPPGATRYWFAKRFTPG